MQHDKPCGRPLFDGEHCIFHSKDIERKKGKFNDVFGKEFEKQREKEKIYDFRGFIFPGDISFKETKKFEKDVYFSYAKFYGEADFFETEFHGNANFVSVKFSGRSNFSRAKFSENNNANFSLSKFHGFADFSGAEFYGKANFTGALFFENAGFNSFRYCGEVDFREVKFYKKAEFQRTCYKDEDVNNLSFKYSYFFNVRGLFEFIEENKKDFKYSKKPKLEFLPAKFRLILGEEATARYPVISRKIRDDMYLLDFQSLHPCKYKIWQCLANCGRKFTNLSIWCMVIVLIFAVFYCCFPHAIKPDYINKSLPFFSYLYYSIVTFSTLGFGDIVPLKWWMQITVAVQVIWGYIMLGGLISILANKLARRS